VGSIEVAVESVPVAGEPNKRLSDDDFALELLKDGGNWLST
jgi:hypothetical protein